MVLTEKKVTRYVFNKRKRQKTQNFKTVQS